MTLENTFIKCLSPEHGLEIIDFYKRNGYPNSKSFVGDEVGYYYGVSPNARHIRCIGTRLHGLNKEITLPAKEEKPIVFNLGDAVECRIFGKGRVTVRNNTNLSHYPVGVSFDFTNGASTHFYTDDGKYSSGYPRTLTKGSWEIKEIPPKITFEVGERVWALESDSGIWMATYVTLIDGDRIFVSKKQVKDRYSVIAPKVCKFDEIPF